MRDRSPWSKHIVMRSRRKWLRSMGRNADESDWGSGETIAVTIGDPEMVGDIEVYPGAVHLYPTDEGRWQLVDFGRLDPPITYPHLESAMHAAHEYIGERELALREAS